MRKPVDYQHPEARLMGSTVRHEGHNCTVVGLQGGYATVSRSDGFKRSIPIYAITNGSKSV
ncbi:hypothetical protein PV396_41905 [Streptomyces sp. ME02-8801-2C]|uniref:hypothetical protein n=1 Tax=Streptomyces sp. ME02-8801-2C TaxID=3028680 RepID=UPI0029AD1A73|nr:hypothetical protein [Streptomyces sp. ME02-8801-2C]MDX3458420.1 hypothetical protein [Streptomyces sp. ME02-8801-2C]